MNNITQKIINFVKYHNGFTIGLILVFVFSGAIFASEDVRDAVIGEEIITETGVDNSYLLLAALDNFDVNLTIDNVLEDEKNYYIYYSFNTIAVQDNVWQPIIKSEKFTVNKEVLGKRDLGLYLAEELGEAANSEIVYLKKSQETEIEKGKTLIVKTLEYTGLIGLVLDTETKVLPGYEPVIPEPEPEICDGLDNDLDGAIDEGLAIYSGSNIGQCQAAIINCVNGAMIQTQTEITPTEEICNDNIDNNCNGETDEGCCLPSTEICDNIDNDCDGLVDEDNVCQPVQPIPTEPVCGADHLDLCETKADCLDAGGYWYGEICNTDPEIIPDSCDSEHLELCATQELCEAASLYWYNDICNTEAEAPPQDVCDIDHLNLCTAQAECETAAGFWYNEGCNAEPEIPVCQPTEEVCDGLDNDCNDLVDENLGQTTCGIGACEATIDNCADGISQTCVPGTPTEEICDGKDNDCDGEVDEDVDCGAISCDPDSALNLTGEDCQNTCIEGICQFCVPTCICIEGWNDCDDDLTNGCETADSCEPADEPEEPEE